MTVFAASSSTSQLLDSVSAPSIREFILELPASSQLIVPVHAIVPALHQHWAFHRPGEPLPTITTLPAFIRGLANRFLDPELTLMDDVDAELLLQRALEISGERFRPSGLTLSRIIRWKQEQQTLERVVHDFPSEGRSADLRDLDRVLKVWETYEDLKGGSIIDRGDVSLQLVDALAILSELPSNERYALAAIHGLSETDKLTFHLLARLGADCGIRFADHTDSTNRSFDVSTWLQGHGWTTGVLEPETKAKSITLVSTGSPRHEVRGVLGAVKEHVTKGGYPHDIAIVLPADGSYDAMMRAEATAAAIPLQLYRSTSLASHASATAVRALCDVTLEGWTTSSVEHLAAASAIGTTVAIGKLSEAASTFRILGGNGADAWMQRIKRSRETLEALPEDEDRSVKSLLRLAREAESIVRSINTLLGTVDLSPTAEEFVEWISDTLIKNFAIMPHERFEESLERYVQFCTVHNQTNATLREHVERWWTIVKSVDVANDQPKFNGISAVRANELRYRSFERIFMLGLVEGVLPRRREDPIERTLMPDHAMLQDRESIADVLSAISPGGWLTVLWPETKGGDPTLASRFVDELRELSAIDANMDSPFQSLAHQQQPLLLSQFDRAAVSEEVVDFGGRQSGLDVGELSAEARKVVDTIVAKPVGPSRIDSVTSCPYAYYAQNILQLDEPLDMDERLSGLERGTLMHNVAQKFFESHQTIEAEGITSVSDIQERMVNLDASIDSYVTQLDELFLAEREKLPQGYLYDDVERSMYFDSEERKGLLRRWIEKEVNLQEESDYRPILFEVEYNGPIEFRDGMVEEVKLRIDRIDAKVNGSDVELRVVDYKTSSAFLPSAPKIESGNSAQMPLYAASAVAWFKRVGIDAVVGEYAYHTFGKSIKNERDPVTKGSSKVGVLKSGLENTADAVTELRQAHFPVRPLNGACTYCAYSEVCRIEHWGIQADEAN